MALAVLEVVRAVLRVVVMEVAVVQAAVSEVEMALEDLVMEEVEIRVLEAAVATASHVWRAACNKTTRCTSPKLVVLAGAVPSTTL